MTNARQLTNLRLIDGLGNVFEHAAITIGADGRIADVMTDARVATNAAAQIEDLGGATVLPGLIDCHVHLMFDSRARSVDDLVKRDSHYLTLIGAANARTLLRAGVTTARDLAGVNFGDVAIRDAINAGLIPGPRLLVSGKCLTMTGGHGWHIGQEVDGCDEARKFARVNLKRGADNIKMMASGGVMTPGVQPQSPALSRDELRAGFDEANKAGKLSACHAQSNIGVKWAIEAGVRTLEHGFWLDDEACQMMLDKGVYYCPTLSAPQLILQNAGAGIPADVVAKVERAVEAHVRSVALARSAGVNIICGTDSGTPFNPHGGTWGEIELLSRHGGLSPMQAISSATRIAAEALKVDAVTGTIETGKYADLLVVAGDPLKDLRCLRKPQRIFKGGIDVPVDTVETQTSDRAEAAPTLATVQRFLASGCGCL